MKHAEAQLPPDFRSEAFYEDLLDEAPATASGQLRHMLLTALPLLVAALGSVLPFVDLPR